LLRTVILLALTTLTAAVPYTAPDGDFTGDGQVDVIDLQCGVLVFEQLSLAEDPPQSQCQSHADCAAEFGPTFTCRSAFAGSSLCMPGCLSPFVTFGPDEEVQCLEPDAETALCKGLVQKKQLDLNCDDTFNSTDVNFLVSVITGKTGGPGTSDFDGDGRLNACDDDSDADLVVDTADCDALDPAVGDCDDGLPCTADTCVNGACDHVLFTGDCDDGNPGTSDDTCQPDGSCAGQSNVTCGPLAGSTGALGSLTLSGTAVINTSAGTITAGGQTLVAAGSPGVELVTQSGSANGYSAPGLAVFHFQDLEIAPGASVQVTGSRGVALLSAGALTVSGALDASGGAGSSGSTNGAGSGGAAGPGGWSGTGFQPLGCVSGNGDASGPGAGDAGECGDGGNNGGSGYSGGGGGGGGGGTGGTGGGGGGHATAGGDGAAGITATAGSSGIGSGGSGGNAGWPGSPSAGGDIYGTASLPVLFGGTGGASGAYGGFAGFGGKGGGSGGGYGGAPGYSGGPGGGGGGGGAVLLCGASLDVTAGGQVNARGGYGGGGGGSGWAEGGQSPSFYGDDAKGGGGGAGRSGGGGGGGAGAGGSVYLAGGTVTVYGAVDASGGGGGFTGWSGSGGYGANGANGGGKGGSGGSGGKGGLGGVGGSGYIHIKSGDITLQGDLDGVVTQSP